MTQHTNHHIVGNTPRMSRRHFVIGQGRVLLASTEQGRFTAERDRDFYRVCRLIASSSRKPLTPREIVARAVNHPAPGYYVDYTYALRVLGNIGKMPRADAARASRGKWLELYDRCMEAMAAGAPGIGMALVDVLASGRASGFFISVSRGLRILRDAERR